MPQLATTTRQRARCRARRKASSRADPGDASSSLKNTVKPRSRMRRARVAGVASRARGGGPSAKEMKRSQPQRSAAFSARGLVAGTGGTPGRDSSAPAWMDAIRLPVLRPVRPIISTYPNGFRVSLLGSVNPSPLGDRDATFRLCKMQRLEVTRSGTASITSYGSRSIGFQCWGETSGKGLGSFCARLREPMR